MEFVIDVLHRYFLMDFDQASQIMLKVHYEGKGMIGVFTKDVAEIKANQLNSYARLHGHPLVRQIDSE